MREVDRGGKESDSDQMLSLSQLVVRRSNPGYPSSDIRTITAHTSKDFQEIMQDTRPA